MTPREPKALMKNLFAVLILTAFSLATVRAEDLVEYAPKPGPGAGKHIVLIAGDEEYRSEEALPQLAKILSQRHGFKCTVLFSVDAEGFINPDAGGSLSNPAALDSADAIVMLLRFRHWDDHTTGHFAEAVNRGVPIIGLRTSTHAFSGIPKESPFAKWNYGNKGGFGKQVLGETWVTHWGRHKVEAMLGVIEKGQEKHPLFNGVQQIFADSDVYEAYPPADAKILVRGQVLKGMTADTAPADYKKKRATDKEEQGVNDPMMPVVWTREVKNEAGKVNKVFTTTMGAATDLQSEGTRRLVINSVFWGLGLEIPAKANVDYLGDYKPSMYSFKGYKKGVKPSDHKL